MGTTVCATDLLLSGLIDRYPNVKILFAHGGGFLPYQIGRLDKGYEQWKLVSTNLQAPPSEYLKRFWYDTVLWNKESLEFLSNTVGVDRVCSRVRLSFCFLCGRLIKNIKKAQKLY